MYSNQFFARLAVVHTLESPNKARIKVLSSRIVGVNYDRESERQSRHDEIGSKLRGTEDLLARTQISSDGSYKLTKDKLKKLKQPLGEDEKSPRPYYPTRRSKVS